ncbi:hypothetical protein [Streptomyces sp. NPDC093094]|uniref:hypothetical protein n=1 Tax=Streptomyces sp. NPDC093094 TaxID=3366026 RepID=UPI00380479C8
MTVDALRVLAAAAAGYDGLESRLTARDLARLASLLAVLRAAGTTDEARRDAAGRAAALLRPVLEPDAAAALGAARFTGTGTDPGFLGFRPEDLAVLVLDGHRMVGPILGPVRDRLLAVPARETGPRPRPPSDQDVPGPSARDTGTDARAGADPEADAETVDLIGLPVGGGRLRLPAFQFAADGRPRPVVLTVNRLLDARRDPWGVADWWLSPNAWLAEAPHLLLGTPREAEVIEAARCLTEAD